MICTSLSTLEIIDTPSDLCLNSRFAIHHIVTLKSTTWSGLGLLTCADTVSP